MGYIDSTLPFDQILKSHERWADGLLKAVQSHDRDIVVGHVCRDDKCEFGQWFYSLPQDTQKDMLPHYARRLHSRMHQMAGEAALSLASGHFEEAERALKAAEFRSVLSEMTKALENWRNSIRN